MKLSKSFNKLIVICLLTLACAIGSFASRQSDRIKGERVQVDRPESESVPMNFKELAEPTTQVVDNISTTVGTTTIETTSETTTVVTEPQAYDHNMFYDVIDEYQFVDHRGEYTYVIHEVLAKKDAAAYISMTAYAENGDVIGKCDKSYPVYLYAGEISYFFYFYKSNGSNEVFDFYAYVEEPYNMIPKDAIRTSKWNVNGDFAYVSLEQTKPINQYICFDVLYLKDGRVVDIDYQLTSEVYAPRLNGVGSTDVLELVVRFVPEFDDIVIVVN